LYDPPMEYPQSQYSVHIGSATSGGQIGAGASLTRISSRPFLSYSLLSSYLIALATVLFLHHLPTQTLATAMHSHVKLYITKTAIGMGQKNHQKMFFFSNRPFSPTFDLIAMMGF
jgi:hypothetical protein